MTSKHVIRPSTQAAIIEAAVQVLNKNPQASISEVALKAGVGRATLHRHYSSRDALIDAISIDCIEEMNAAVLAAMQPETDLHAQLQALFRVTIAMGDRFNFLQQVPSENPAVRKRYAQQLKWLQQLVDRLQQAGLVRNDLPGSWVIAQIDQLVWTAWREVSAGRLVGEDAAVLALNTLLNGVGEVNHKKETINEN